MQSNESTDPEIEAFVANDLADHTESPANGSRRCQESFGRSKRKLRWQRRGRRTQAGASATLKSLAFETYFERTIRCRHFILPSYISRSRSWLFRLLPTCSGDCLLSLR